MVYKIISSRLFCSQVNIMPAFVVSDLQVPFHQQTKCAIPFPPENKKIKIRFFFSNSQPIYNNTVQPVCMYSTTLTHVALKKSSEHKSRHIFQFHFSIHVTESKYETHFYVKF